MTNDDNDDFDDIEGLELALDRAVGHLRNNNPELYQEYLELVDCLSEADWGCEVYRLPNEDVVGSSLQLTLNTIKERKLQ